MGSLTINAKTQTKLLECAERAKEGIRVSKYKYIPRIYQLGESIDIWVETIMHQFGHGVILSILEYYFCQLKDGL